MFLTASLKLNNLFPCKIVHHVHTVYHCHYYLGPKQILAPVQSSLPSLVRMFASITSSSSSTLASSEPPPPLTHNLYSPPPCVKMFAPPLCVWEKCLSLMINKLFVPPLVCEKCLSPGDNKRGHQTHISHLTKCFIHVDLQM